MRDAEDLSFSILHIGVDAPNASNGAASRVRSDEQLRQLQDALRQPDWISDTELWRVVVEYVAKKHVWVDDQSAIACAAESCSKNFADTGEITLNVHRHVCSKNIRLIGLTNHPSTGYGPALRLLERYADRYPFEEFVSHEFGLADADLALHTSMSPESLKVVINPSLP